jgi:hypothetical protein
MYNRFVQIVGGKRRGGRGKGREREGGEGVSILFLPYFFLFYLFAVVACILVYFVLAVVSKLF